jgi:hypothetical protein
MDRLSRPSLTGIGGMLGLILLILPYLVVANTHSFPIRGRGRISSNNDLGPAKRSTDLSWRDTIKLSPAHQNPAKAPAVPIPNPPPTNNSISLNPSARGLRSFAKRGDGPFSCKDGPCADDSCCGPKGICGYGPDFTVMAAHLTAMPWPCAENIARMPTCRAA